jgi:hypothetical protein
VTKRKVCRGEIYELYTYLNTRFKSYAFEVYKALMCVKHDSIIMQWMTNLNTCIQHLGTRSNKSTSLLYKRNVNHFLVFFIFHIKKIVE